MMSRDLRYRSAAVLVLVCAAPAFADAFVPAINLFDPDTALPTLLLTILIVLVESLFLRWRIREVPFRVTLWRALWINLASAAAGSLILWPLEGDSLSSPPFILILFLLFIITLAVEIPALRYAYRGISMSEARAMALGLAQNAISYGLVLILGFGLVWYTFAWSGHREQEMLREWKHPEMLAQLPGTICRFDSGGLVSFDPESGAWKLSEYLPENTTEMWDLEHDLFASVLQPDEKGSRVVGLFSLPGLVPEQTVDLGILTDAIPEGWMVISEIRISPDLSKLAVLVRVALIDAPRNRTSHYELGEKCRLVVFDLEDGETLGVASRCASGGHLEWLLDSSRVVFLSYKDESLYNIDQSQVEGDTSIIQGLVHTGPFALALYVHDVVTGEVEYLVDAHSPTLNPATGDLLVRKEGVLCVVEVGSRKMSRLELRNLYAYPVCYSPDGRYLLADVANPHILQKPGFLTIIDLKEPESRHIIDPRVTHSRFVWTGFSEASRGSGEGVSSEKP